MFREELFAVNLINLDAVSSKNGCSADEKVCLRVEDDRNLSSDACVVFKQSDVCGESFAAA